jgi:hypothetical protein
VFPAPLQMNLPPVFDFASFGALVLLWCFGALVPWCFLALSQTIGKFSVPVEVINRSMSRTVGPRFFLAFLIYFYSKNSFFKVQTSSSTRTWGFGGALVLWCFGALVVLKDLTGLVS